jgi:hypothetical protein
MIAIFGDFRLFSAKKFAFLSKTNVVIKFLLKLAVHSLSKNANFLTNFFAKIFLKIIILAPGHLRFKFVNPKVQ